MNIDLSPIADSGAIRIADSVEMDSQEVSSSSSISVLDAWLRNRSEDLPAPMFNLDQWLPSFA